MAQPGGDPTPRGPGTEAGLSPPERLHRGPGSPTRPRGPGGQGGSPVSEDLSPDARGGTHSGSSVPMRCPPLHHPHPAPKRKRLGEAGSNPDSRLPLTRQPGPQSARPRGAGRNTASCRPCPPPPPSRGECGCSLSPAPLQPDTNPAPQGPGQGHRATPKLLLGGTGAVGGARDSPPPGEVAVVKPAGPAAKDMADTPRGYSTALHRPRLVPDLSSPGPGGSGTFHLPLWRHEPPPGPHPHPRPQGCPEPGQTQLGGSGNSGGWPASPHPSTRAQPGHQG